MTAPNAARDARPGDRFTDPNGGTWLRRFPDAESAWFEFTAAGHLVLRTQDEAEKADLVPLVAETGVPDYGKCTGADDCDSRDHYHGCFADRDGAHCDEPGEHPATPAPLDPGNPEHLRQVARVLNHFTAFRHRLGDVEGQRAAVMLFHLLRSEADRIEREAADAEQDRKDRERAAEVARQAHSAYAVIVRWDALEKTTRENLTSIALAGLRAGRAEREEETK